MTSTMGSSWFNSSTSYAEAHKINSSKSHPGHFAEIIDKKHLNACLNCDLPECKNCFGHTKKKKKSKPIEEKKEGYRMPSIFDIQRKYEALLEGNVNPDTGEVTFDDAAYEAIEAEKAEKLEAIGLDYKNCIGMVKAIKNAREELDKKIERFNKRAEHDKALLEMFMEGEGFSTARVNVSYKKNPKKVVLDSEFIEWAKQHHDDLLKYKEPEADKTLIKKLIESGEEVKFATLVQDTTLNIK